jgi:hypothetical protein
MRRMRTTNRQDVESCRERRSRIEQDLNVFRVRLGLALSCGLAGQQL